MYYVVLALLYKENKNPRTHHGTRKLFSSVCVNEKNFNRDLFNFYSKLLNKRETADYDMFSIFTEHETENIINNAILFIEEAKTFL